jgi:hypothetical protein
MYEWMRKLITVDQSTSPKIRRRRREVDVTAEKSRVCRIRWVFHFRNLTRIFETSAFA